MYLVPSHLLSDVSAGLSISFGQGRNRGTSGMLTSLFPPSTGILSLFPSNPENASALHVCTVRGWVPATRWLMKRPCSVAVRQALALVVPTRPVILHSLTSSPTRSPGSSSRFAGQVSRPSDFLRLTVDSRDSSFPFVVLHSFFLFASRIRSAVLLNAVLIGHEPTSNTSRDALRRQHSRGPRQEDRLEES